MSRVVEGTDVEPGTLVTFVGTPAGTGSVTDGEPIDINGIAGYLEEWSQPDGTHASAITLRIGDVVIDGHGNADRTTLVELMQSVRLLDENEWSQLVAELDAG